MRFLRAVDRLLSPVPRPRIEHEHADDHGVVGRAPASHASDGDAGARGRADAVATPISAPDRRRVAPSSDLVALNATTGEALWHAGLNSSVANGPITYKLDGLQYVVAGAGDTIWTFVLNR